MFKRQCFLLLMLISMSFSVFAANNHPKIILLGDSLSAAYGIRLETSWVELLSKKLDRDKIPLDLINASISGQTTDNALVTLPKLLKQYEVAWVFLELGGNDGLRAISLDSTKANFEAMINIAKKAGAKVALFEIEIPPNYGKRYRKAFTKMYQSLATTHNLPTVEFLLKNVALKPGMMQDDGLHPTEAAQPIILETVWPSIKKLLVDHELA